MNLVTTDLEKLAIVTSAYTGVLCCKNFGDVQEYAEKVLGRPLWTHEFGTKELVDELRDRCRSEFLELWGLA